MVPTLFFYQLGLVALVGVFLMLCWLWSTDAASPHQPIVPTKPSRRKRSKEPKPFAGLTQRPQCALCEREATQAHEPSPAPPEPLPPTNRRPRTVETSQHFCPHGGCRYRGWLGRGNLRANGHPHGGPWRQFPVYRVRGVFPRTPRDDLPWQAGRRGTHCARAGVLSRGARYSRHRPSLRGRPQYGAALVGRSSRAASGLYKLLPV